MDPDAKLKAATAEFLRHERAMRDDIAVKLTALLGGSIEQGGPVALREVDEETGVERFYSIDGTELGIVEPAYMQERPVILLYGMHRLD